MRATDTRKEMRDIFPDAAVPVSFRGKSIWSLVRWYLEINNKTLLLGITDNTIFIY